MPGTCFPKENLYGAVAQSLSPPRPKDLTQTEKLKLLKEDNHFLLLKHAANDATCKKYVKIRCTYKWLTFEVQNKMAVLTSLFI